MKVPGRQLVNLVLHVWLILLVGATCSSKRATPAGVKASGNPVREGQLATLDVSFPSTRVLTDHYVAIEIGLTNVTSRDLWVNGRMLLNREDDPPEVRELWIMIQGPDGKDVPYECSPRARFVDERDYRLLKPHDTIHKTEILNGCYPIRALGVYKLAAFYKDGNPKPPPPPAGAVYLSQDLQSEPASFEIVAAL